MGALALFLVIAGGTAYAADEWTGANIVDGSLTGADIRDNSVTGANVRETSLGTVPVARRLLGLAPRDFVQGRSSNGSSNSRGGVYFNRLRLSIEPDQRQDLLVVPGVLRIEAICGPGLESSSVAEFGIYSLADGVGLDLQSVVGSNAQTNYETHDSGGGFAVGVRADPQNPENSMRLSIQAGRGFNDGFKRLVTMDLSTYIAQSTNTCVFQGSALNQSD